MLQLLHGFLTPIISIVWTVTSVTITTFETLVTFVTSATIITLETLVTYVTTATRFFDPHNFH